MTKKEIVTAAFVIIGDEILSGRTADKNMNFLAQRLTETGINLCEVRVVPDVEKEIIEAVNALRAKFDYVFTSGGIGPTHDDITAAAIAKAFNDEFIKHPEAAEILYQHYGRDKINEAQMKMAFMPKSARLLDNPLSSVPGFRIENVFVLAGIPRNFQAMVGATKKELVGGKKIKMLEMKLALTESFIAKDFANLQQKYSQVAMGSYPSEEGTALVFRSTDYEALEKSFAEMVEILEKNKPHSILEKSKLL